MLRGVATKITWVGRATVFLVGLAVILALVVGVASMAFGANGGNFILGQNNTATLLTKLTGNVNGAAAMQVQNTNAGTDDTALNLIVQSGEAPMKVNSATKVTNLNADSLDGIDSSAFGIQVQSRTVRTHGCNEFGVWAQCAGITVRVPAGKTYFVSVWSDSVVKGGASNQILTYCSGMRRVGEDSFRCDESNLSPRQFTNWAGGLNPVSSSGEFGPLTAGTYTFSTYLNPKDAIATDTNALTTTKVMVRDGSAPRPPIN